MSAPNPVSDLGAAFEEHQDELLGFLRQQVQCPEQAAELRQEVYLRLQRAEMPGRIGDLRAYLYRIARNLLIDTHRHRRVEEALFASSPTDDAVASSAPSPEAAVAGIQELANLRLALAELPQAQRCALLWYRLEGVTLREIAERLGVSESMVSRYVSKALAHCEQRLGRGVL